MKFAYGLCYSVGSLHVLRTGGRWFDRRFSQCPVVYLRIDDSHCDWIYSFFTAVVCLSEKTSSIFERILCGVLVQTIPGNYEQCIGRRDIAEVMLKTALNIIQNISPLGELIYHLELCISITFKIRKCKNKHIRIQLEFPF